MSDTILIRHEAPKGFQFISEEEYERFQSWKQAQRGIRTWKLKDLARYKYGTKSTERASRYLTKHRHDLDIEQGGFIDYVNTHNGWQIPAAEMMDYLLDHPD
ncbi:DUF771 domain-containing protein [Lactiplantibacillus plantarum]|jgi:phage pi2 protein 07|uniref:DUF771 domain-containing protein n=1 Tax=Lactiplantibacillus plantarum TaxID=1590 RepID=UPI0006A64FEE|nr:DUF771 domain-containing protein [Lactiplantibacillus plantarum]MDN6029354.1 DUF771 domain-containing protein [Lactobacillus sp.]ASD31953.1 DUF771 domain-containing protein [Lactiplantibacillus plantarum]AXI13186.1 DUF771 domain-containing protein [Lactiplantibacillus plantarum]KOE71377.1 prophage P2a protein 12 [Lactiplantibacillus plantarum]MBW4800154.1 DUF771 domain-containing protein [Lactiplantibacillus plantarum]